MPRSVHPTPFIIRPSETIATDFDLRKMSRDLATKYADGHVVTDDDLQIMGRNLWNLLGVQDEFDAAQKAAGDAILSVIIESDKPEVQAYPWETLYHPIHKFIGRNPSFTLTRRIVEGKPSQAPLALDKGPLRVLLFTSLPDNVDAESGRLNVEEEQAQVQEALLPWIASGVVQLEMPDDGRFSTLKELLGRFDPLVLFLSGHGKFHHEPHADEAYGEFLFESETGDGEAIRDAEIAQVLRGTGVRAVILSACESGKAASDYLSNGLMQRISAAGILHVVGMRESIYDIAGIQFARVLCDELAGRERIDVALQSARVAIQTSMDERGQWCLPMALSPNPQAQIIDWDFQPQAVEAQRLNQRVNTVSLPARFVGRRAEMRRYKIKLTQGALRSLLITGAGGMGKTSLAGKLALDVQRARGDGLFAWSANSEKSMRDFELEMGQTLDKPRMERYDKVLPKAENEVERAKFMLDLLAEQFNGRVILFFDNLETLQDADSLAVKDATVAAWMQAARGTDGVTVFATSRWQIPDWDGEHLMLARANYGDFLQIAAMKNLPIRREQMRRVYDALGGNIRGLEFFAAATQGMDDENAEEAFLQTLEQTKSDLQANMAIAEIYKHLPEDAKKLFARLPAYHEAVPMEGLLKLGEDLPNAEASLERLMAVSLLEASCEPHWNVTEYQCAPMVMDWMNENGLVDNSPKWFNISADYHLFLHENERKTLEQAISTHRALRHAERHDEADRFVLEHMIEPMVMKGLYMSLLDEWIPRICNSEDAKIQSVALNNMGQIYLRIGNIEKARFYAEKSLAISKQIGDRDTEGGTLSIISSIYELQGDYNEALSFIKQSLAINQQTSNKSGEGTMLGRLSQIYFLQGDYDLSLSYGEQSLAICRQISDRVGEGVLTDLISQVFRVRGDYETAMSYLKQSLSICRQIGDKEGEGRALGNISHIYYAQSNYEMALMYYKQALAIKQQIGDKASEGTTLGDISLIYYALDDYEAAFSYLKQSLSISQQIGDKAGEGTALNHISDIYAAKGDYDTALSYLKQSLVIMQQIDNKSSMASVLRNIGDNYYSQGDYRVAFTYLEQSLSIYQQIDHKAGIGITLNRISDIYRSQGDNEKALSCLIQALTISQQIGDKTGEGEGFNDISKILIDQGDYETALSYQERALAIMKQIGDKKSEANVLHNIGDVYYGKEEHEKALSYYKQSLIIARQLETKAHESAALNSIGLIYEAQNDDQMALSYLLQALAIDQQIGDKAGSCVTLFNLGNTYLRMKKTVMGVEAWRDSYLIAKEIGHVRVLQILEKVTPLFDMYERGEKLDAFAKFLDTMREEGEGLDFLQKKSKGKKRRKRRR